jgi:hypothetical protein
LFQLSLRRKKKDFKKVSIERRASLSSDQGHRQSKRTRGAVPANA